MNIIIFWSILQINLKKFLKTCEMMVSSLNMAGHLRSKWCCFCSKFGANSICWQRWFTSCQYCATQRVWWRFRRGCLFRKKMKRTGQFLCLMRWAKQKQGVEQKHNTSSRGLVFWSPYRSKNWDWGRHESSGFFSVILYWHGMEPYCGPEGPWNDHSSMPW